MLIIPDAPISLSPSPATVAWSMYLVSAASPWPVMSQAMEHTTLSLNWTPPLPQENLPAQPCYLPTPTFRLQLQPLLMSYRDKDTQSTPHRFLRSPVSHICCVYFYIDMVGKY